MTTCGARCRSCTTSRCGRGAAALTNGRRVAAARAHRVAVGTRPPASPPAAPPPPPGSPPGVLLAGAPQHHVPAGRVRGQAGGAPGHGPVLGWRALRPVRQGTIVWERRTGGGAEQEGAPNSSGASRGAAAAAERGLQARPQPGMQQQPSNGSSGSGSLGRRALAGRPTPPLPAPAPAPAPALQHCGQGLLQREGRCRPDPRHCQGGGALPLHGRHPPVRPRAWAALGAAAWALPAAAVLPAVAGAAAGPRRRRRCTPGYPPTPPSTAARLQRPQARELFARVQGRGRAHQVHRLWAVRLLQAQPKVQGGGGLG